MNIRLYITCLMCILMFEKKGVNIKGISLFFTWKRCFRIIFVLFFVLLLLFKGNSLAQQNIAQTNDSEIFFMGYEPLENSTRFIYRVDSGSSALSYWEISDYTFDIGDMEDASEGFVYLDGKLRFIEKYSKDQIRDVWFILNKKGDDFSLVQISVKLVADDGERTVQVVGPVCLTSDESVVTSFFNKQNIITVGVTVMGFILLYFFNKK